VPNDAALYDCPDYPKFLINKIQQLQKKFGKVASRPHPLASKTPIANPVYVVIKQIPGAIIIDPNKSSLIDNKKHVKLVVN